MSAAALLGLVALTSCSPGARENDAAEVAGRFVAAVAGHDGVAACALLTGAARESVSGATNATCAVAVVNVQEHGSTAGNAQVWGDSAQVHIGTDVVFLLHLRTGWRVSAAGCKRQPVGPYKCDVDG